MRMDPVLRLGAPHKVTEGHTTSVDCCSVQTHKLNYWTQVFFIKVFHNWIKTQLRAAWVEALKFVCVCLCASLLWQSQNLATVVIICLILWYCKTLMSARVWMCNYCVSKSSKWWFTEMTDWLTTTGCLLLETAKVSHKFILVLCTKNVTTY